MVTLIPCPVKMIRKYCRLLLVVVLMLSALYVMTSHVGNSLQSRVEPENPGQDEIVNPLRNVLLAVDRKGNDAVVNRPRDDLNVNDPNRARNDAEIRPRRNNVVGNIGVKNEGTIAIKEPLPAVTAPPAVGGVEHVAAPKPAPDAIESLPNDVLLDPRLAPNTVYYVWCGRRWFEFVHYLSVMSVMRFVRPDNVVFYYDSYPVLDYWLYNTWFDEIKQQYPFFRPRFVNTTTENMCSGHGIVNMAFVYKRLTRRGGMYVNENTILASFPISLRRYDMVDAIEAIRGTGFLLTQGGLPGVRSVSAVIQDPAKRTSSIRCAASIAEYNAAAQKPVCITPESKLFPKDIWTLDSDFGRMSRKVFYGRPEVPIQRQSFDDLVPNIAHIVWLGGGPMDFLFYLCVLSLIYVAKVDVVYIHGDAPPTGIYWQRVRDHQQVKLIFRESPRTVYGNDVSVISHVTDIWRVDFMLKYGGVYVDTDTVFVRELDRNIRSYDAVGSYDWTYWNPPFPDTINFGVAVGKRNATYWRLFQESMRWFIDKDWSWNGLRQPYKVQERHPELLRLDPHLQVICFEFKCHPTWWPNYHDESIHHGNSGGKTLDWRTDVYAFHWTLPTPKELTSEEHLMAAKGMFADIGRYILKKAGLLKL
ncbi:hypothetical protein NP493_421g01047 [Ridgeia piscesae]|uniref:Alpha 1,4-glycosyltransferase domain-containing protein n=1 Tax=Ridgeia piscesae TaxID=27915 RepID=A0AAD9L182_RIDPI|nr:hypothetical protein NP493_421g01047 [Ridgeia piscesae]